MNDPHKKSAAKLFNVPYKEVTDEQRRLAKMWTLVGCYDNIYTTFAQFVELYKRHPHADMIHEWAENPERAVEADWWRALSLLCERSAYATREDALARRDAMLRTEKEEW